SHEGEALIDSPALEIGAAQEPGGVRTVQREVRLTGEAAGALEHGAGSVEVPPDEVDVPQHHAGNSQAVRAAELFSEGDPLAAGGHPLLNLPALRQTTREPREVVRLIRLPGAGTGRCAAEGAPLPFALR